MVIIMVFVLIFLEDKVVYGSENVESKRHLQDVKEDNQNYYFKMSDAEIDEFLIKVKNLQKGTDIKEVIDCLGEPFSNYEIRSKKIEYSRKSGFQAQHTESAFLKLYSMTRTGT